MTGVSMTNKQQQQAASAAFERRSQVSDSQKLEEEEEDEDYGVYPAVFGSGEVLPEPVRLRAEARSFIPTYHPTMSLSDFERSLQGEFPGVEYLLNKGYPRHWIARVSSASITGKALNPFAPRERRQQYVDEDAQSKRVTGVYHNTFEKGEVARKWRIRAQGAPRVPKPSRYTHASFRAWADGEASYYARRFNKPTDYVSGSLSAQALYHGGSAATAKMTQRMLDTAAIFPASYHAGKDVRFSYSTYADHLCAVTSKELTVSGRVFKDSREWEEAAPILRRHKPLFRAGQRYFAGEDEDHGKLQRALLASFPTEAFVSPKEDSTKIVHQGWLDSSHEVTHKFIMPGLKESLSALLGDKSETATRLSVQVIAAVVGIWTSTSWTNAVAVLTQLVASNSTLFEVVTKRLAALGSPPEYQGLGEWFQAVNGEYIRPLWEMVVGSIITFMTETFFPSITEMINPIIFSIVGSFKKAFFQQTGEALARSCLAAVREVFERIRACVQSGSFAPFWGRDWDPERFHVEAETIVAHKNILLSTGVSVAAVRMIADLRESGKLSPQWFEPVARGVFADRCEALIARGVEMESYFKKDVTISGIIRRDIKMLREMVSVLNVQATALRPRSAPFFLYLFGAPGVGKTTIASILSDAIGHVAKFPLDTGAHVWQTTANFQDGLSSDTWRIFMDDVDQSIAPLNGSTKTHIESVIDICNNVPFPVEQARVEDKGTVYASPALLVVTSNFQDMRVTSFSRMAEAFIRRIDMHVEVKVKPEFALENGRIDQDRVHDEKDIYDFYVRFPAKHRGKGSVFNEDPVVYNLYTLMAALQDGFRAHRTNQAKVVHMLSSKTVLCGDCGLPSLPKCACPEVLVEDVEESTPADETVSIEHQGVFDVMLWGLKPDRFNRAYHFCTVLYFVGCGAVLFRDLVRISAPHYDARLRGLANHAARSNYMTLEDIEEAESYGADCTLLRAKHGHPPAGSWVQFKRKYVGTAEWKLKRALFVYGPPLAAAASLVGVVLMINTAMDYSFDYMFQGRVANATAGLLPMTWTRAEQKFTPGLAPSGAVTYTYDDLQRSIKDAHCVVSAGGQSMTAYVVGGSTIVFPSHLTMSSPVITILHKNKTMSVTQTTMNSMALPSNRELAIIHCPELFGGSGILNRLPLVRDETIVTYDEMVLYNPSVVYEPEVNQVRRVNAATVITTNAATIAGDCGTLYVGRHGSKWTIVGMHYALAPNPVSTFTLGGLLLRQEIAACARHLNSPCAPVVTNQGMLTGSAIVPRFSPFDARSEVWAAITAPGASIQAIGKMDPPLSGGKMISKLKPSAFAHLVEDYATRVCGQPEYWKVPDFRGSMVDGVWVSPYTDAFTTQNVKIPDSQLMALAIVDYLSGMGDLDREGYAVLSEEQMLAGVPGSFLGRVNQKTSVGPPYKGAKTRFMYVGDDEIVMSPEMWELFDEVEASLERGEIPSAFGTVTLKDEPVKPGKMPRVFIVLACAYNFSMRKHGAWQLLMRANPMFFESAVGINMTSCEANKIIAHLAEVDPSLSHLYASDAKRMDKSLSGGLLDAVSVVVRAMSAAIDVSPEESFLLIQGLKHMTYNCKNDLFEILGWNPSGNQATVEINGIVTSLGMRYAHYKLHPFQGDWNEIHSIWTNLADKPCFQTPAGLTFRRDMRLVHYGDDNLVSTQEDLQQEFLDVWQNELGIIMTDAVKSEGVRILAPSTVDKIDFLKRSFVWDEELKFYLTPLHEKSIARMLMIKKDSSMTDPDHAAAIVTDVLREAAYHGAEKYREFEGYADAIVSYMGIENNPYLIRTSFEKKREQMASGSFQTWSNKDAPPLVEERTPIILQSNMSQFNLVNTSNDEVRTSTASTGVVSETTHFVSASAEERAVSSDHPKFFQKMPSHELGNFLERAVQLETITLSNTDSVESIVYTFNPWEQILTNAPFREKVRNFGLIRGTLQVIGNVAASGICYGHYVVTALPNGDATAGVAQNLIVENCRQTDFFVDIDVASSNNFVLQLPWVWPYDYGRVDYTPDMWSLAVTCLMPVRSGIAGGSPTCNVTFFASLLPDHELVLPVYQGKNHEVVANHALKTLAPSLHNKIGEGKLSAMAGAVSSVATSLSKVPVIGSFAAPVASAAAGVEAIASLFGFTRDADERAPLPMSMRSVTNVARFDGPDSGDIAALSMWNSISTDPTLADGVAEDQLSLASIADRWTLVYSQPWTIGQTGIIGTIPVSPFYGRSGGTGRIHLTSAGYYGLPFTYWRADMEYQIIIPRTAVHRGNLQIAWEPNDTLTPTNITNVTINTVIDVSEAGLVQFSVGYAREEPYQLVRPFTRDFGIQPSGTTNGRLILKVINPLTSQSDAADTMIFVFARAKSCSFALPATTVTYLNPDQSGVQPYNLTNEVILQGGSAIGDGIKPDAVSVELVPFSGPFPGKELFFGEEAPSARALMQKPSYARVANGTLQVNATPLVPNVARWTWGGWYAPLFAGIACSTRYKMFPRESCWLGAAPVMRTPDADLLSTLAPMTFAGPALGAEFTVPYYTPRKFVSARSPTNVEPRANQLYLMETDADVVVYESCGPDIRVSRFRQIPTVTFVDRGDPPAMWFT